MARLEKATLTNTVTAERIPVMFNPEEYALSRANAFADATVPGLSAPLVQFVSGGPQTLEMELFVDTYEAHRQDSRLVNRAGQDVRDFTGRITSLMDIDPTTHAPPVVIFAWGSLTFTCVVARVASKFVMFLADGTPVRARLQVALTEFRNADFEAKQIKRETADYTKAHVVGSGETLPAIANAVYGDPGAWRPIAVANDIDDPRIIEAGSVLVVPQLPFRDPSSGQVVL